MVGLKRLSLIFIVLLSIPVTTVLSQGVDYARIELEVSDLSSEFYYPEIYRRYTLNDTTLTLKQYYYLYYGYVFQDEYKPLLKNQYGDSLRMVLNRRTSPSAETFFMAIDYAKKILRTEPFNLREINVLAYAYEMLGDRVAAEKESYKLKMIEKVILSTGDGNSQKTPWWITYNSHADDILALKKFTANKTVALSSTVMYIQAIGENKKRSSVFYFNYSLQYLKRPDYLRDQNGDKIKQDKKPLF